MARGLSAPLNIPYKVAFVLDVAGDNEALVARNGTGVNTIAELKGKRVATPFASTAHYSLLAALAQNGLSPSDVQLVDLQPQAILAAWDRGDIDAAYTWLPTLDDLRKTGKDLITSRQLAKDGKPTLDLGVVADEFAAAHPEVVDTWRQQEARALDVINDDPAAAAKAIAAEIGLSPRRRRGTAQAGRVPDSRPRSPRRNGLAPKGSRATSRSTCRARRSSWPNRSRSRPPRRWRRSRTRSTPRACPVSSVSDLKDAASSATTRRSG